ncbi:hypothetical protein L6452_02655 [Arctium lappa]|uniref:Uncharacterized protein n=1 Tax=Arctium lappa TaxID=4217 RepID=A0ACB9FL07_ARCLA|nr:hypothetical protein L6452_02655 [Arctium lappa]
MHNHIPHSSGNAKTGESSDVRVLTRSSKKDVSPSTRNKGKRKDEGRRVPSVVRIKVKGKDCGVPEENSDSDFETQKKHVSEGSNLRNKPAKQKNMDKKVKQPRKVVGIRTWTSLMILHQTISDLNDKQKKAVNAMGLGSLIAMTVNGIPSKIGFFVVNNLDTENMQMWLEGGSIVINEMTIHEVLKVPVGGLDLTIMESTDESVELATIWKQQYKKESPRPTDVMNAIQSSTDAGNDDPSNDPPLHKWNIEELRKRQASAIKGGGFHKALIRGPGQTTKNTHVNTTPDPPSAKKRDEYEASIKKEYIMELNEKFGLIMRTKVDAQSIIMKDKQRFLSDTVFERYEDELAILFNETEFRGSDAQIQEKSAGKASICEETTMPEQNQSEVPVRESESCPTNL